MPYRSYSAEEWDSMRSVIEDLIYSQSKTRRETVSILANQYDFRVNEGMLQRRITELWGGGTYFTKQYTKRLLESDAYNLLTQDILSVTKLIKSALRHKLEVPASYFHCFTVLSNLYITPPSQYACKLALLSSVSTYVSGAFDARLWSTETFADRIAQEFTGWTCDNPPSVFKVYGYLACATLCSKLGRHEWAQLLIKFGFKELTTCFDEQSPATLFVFLNLMAFFQARMPTEKKKLLRHCIFIVKKHPNSHCLKDALSSMLEIEQEDFIDEYRASLLNDAAAILSNKLRARLDRDPFACAIIQTLHSSTERGDYGELRWVDPISKQREDRKFFNSGTNIERYIVLAVERYGYQELIQIRDMLERQTRWADSNKDLEVLNRYKASLKRPIQRMGYRDHFEDRNQFAGFWRRTTGDGELTRDPKSPNHIMDMLYGIDRFKLWKDDNQVTMIVRHLDIVFGAMAETLRVGYKMIEEDNWH